MKILESHVSPWKIDDRDSFLHALEYVIFEGQDIRILQANQKGMVLENHKREGGWGGGREGESLNLAGESFGVCFGNVPKENFEVNPSLEGLKDFLARYAIFRSLYSM